MFDGDDYIQSADLIVNKDLRSVCIIVRVENDAMSYDEFFQHENNSLLNQTHYQSTVFSSWRPS